MNKNDANIDGRSLEISHPHKVYFPDIGLTKANLISYHRRVAEVMLPHLRERPLSLQRFPDGIDKAGFYQKEAPWGAAFPLA